MRTSSHDWFVLSLAFMSAGACCGLAWAQERFTLEGSDNYVYRVAISPDSRFLASTGYNRAKRRDEIKIWNLNDGKEAHVLLGHRLGTGGPCFSPDGKFLATSGGENTIKLWDVSKWQETATFRTPSGSRQLAFSPDGKMLAAVGREITIWDVGAKKELERIEVTVVSVAFSGDWKRIAMCGADRRVRIWDLAKKNVVAEHARHERLKRPGTPQAVSFSPDGKVVASGDDRGYIVLWDLETGEQTDFNMHYPRKLSEIKSLAFTPNGKMLAAVGWSEAIDFIDMTTRQPWKYKGRVDLSCKFCVAFSPDGKTVVTGGHRIIKVWDFAKLLESEPPPPKPMPSPAPPPG